VPWLAQSSFSAFLLTAFIPPPPTVCPPSSSPLVENVACSVLLKDRLEAYWFWVGASVSSPFLPPLVSIDSLVSFCGRVRLPDCAVFYPYPDLASSQSPFRRVNTLVYVSEMPSRHSPSLPTPLKWTFGTAVTYLLATGPSGRPITFFSPRLSVFWRRDHL